MYLKINLNAPQPYRNGKNLLLFQINPSVRLHCIFLFKTRLFVYGTLYKFYATKIRFGYVTLQKHLFLRQNLVLFVS
jgi:hypothetical protein